MNLSTCAPPPWKHSGNHYATKMGLTFYGAIFEQSLYYSFIPHTSGQRNRLTIVYKREFGIDVKKNGDEQLIWGVWGKDQSWGQEAVFKFQGLGRWTGPSALPRKASWDMQILFGMDMNGGWAPRRCESRGVGKEKTFQLKRNHSHLLSQDFSYHFWASEQSSNKILFKSLKQILSDLLCL